MSTSNPDPQALPDDDSIDLREGFLRIRRSLGLIAGLSLLGFAVGATAFFAAAPFMPVVTSTRVVFSFPGFEKGEYPDKSKFSPDDLRSPEIIAGALQRKGLDASKELQSRVRSALSIEGIIPETVVKERDRARTTGQAVRVYVPDEYNVTLTLPRRFPLSSEQRTQLLGEIVSLYLEKFTRTYITLPLNVGKAFDILESADYFDYELVLNRDTQNLITFLTERAASARAFRSQRTNLSFADLLKQSQLFSQIRLNEVLGLIRRDGISKDRNLAMVKMDYYIKVLADEELKALEQEKVIQSLLQQAREREQGYTLGIKSQAAQPQSENLVVDQGLVDSLLANDAYNFLVREALEAGLKTRRIQSDKAILQERRNIMAGFIQQAAPQQNETMRQLDASIAQLRQAYDSLINDVRLTYEDFQLQQYSDAVRISMQARNESFYHGLLKGGLAGLVVGGALGAGLGLLGFGFGRTKAA